MLCWPSVPEIFPVSVRMATALFWTGACWRLPDGNFDWQRDRVRAHSALRVFRVEIFIRFSRAAACERPIVIIIASASVFVIGEMAWLWC